MAFYKKDGLETYVQIFELATGIWIVPFLATNPNSGVLLAPNLNLAVRNTETNASFLTEAAAIAALIGYTVYNLSTIPTTPTLNLSSISSGASVTVTIASDGDIYVYKNGSTNSTVILNNQEAGSVIYYPPSEGNWRFTLVVGGVPSALSTTLIVSVATGTIIPIIIWPYENSGKIIDNVGNILSGITLGGAYGQILTDSAWGTTARQNWSSNNAYNASDWKWSVNGSAWSTSNFSGINLGSDMAGEIIRVTVGLDFTGDAPKYTFDTIIQLGT
jgi:hypothetical protein